MDKKRKKGFNPVDAVISHGTLTAGTMMGVGLVGKLPSSDSSGQIISSMDTIKIVPTIHASGIAIHSLGSLQDTYKKKKRR